MTNLRRAKTSNHRKTLRFILLVLVLVAANLLIFKKIPYNNITTDELHIMLEKKVPIYDVRRPDEWQQTGVIEDSKLVTYVDANGRLKPDFLRRFTSEINKDDPVILICRTGNRTSILARHLTEKLGYTNIFNVDDGIKQWIRENRPVKQHTEKNIAESKNTNESFVENVQKNNSRTSL